MVVFLQVAHSDAVFLASKAGLLTLMLKTCFTASSVDFTGAFALNTALLYKSLNKVAELEKQWL
ncbi:MAG: hypothetical protein AAF063_05105 [Cyanobacteria bacterium J06643_5]